ncbi:hypothetical protein IMSHALPRED_007265 [Imshaugia aleurites]|uniref:Mannosyltransferase putative-domain-containing protein n=1 Tax=Imshaugia aleurites TaxID=172621 RepID=A0A8H3IGY6_9LECA|nr:hypothetical protein IMSHALPRED_007265 [Imshaugia aleurites]
MKLDGRNTRGRLAILCAISLIIPSALYFASRTSGLNAFRQQGALKDSLLSSHNHQASTTDSYFHRAQEATSALEFLLSKDLELSDLAGKGQRVSALSALLEAIIEDPTIPRDNFFGFRTQEFGWWRLSNKTYLPWENKLESEVGIVMCVGQRDLVLAAHNIRTLRNVLGSKLPIEVFYAGEHDFPWEMRKQLEVLASNIQIMDVLDFYDDTVAGINDSLAQNGWVMKPFAMLASRFQKAILVDADAIFLQRPDAYFNDNMPLKETGTLFFHDRAVKGGYTGWIDTLKWIKTVLKDRKPSATLRESIFWTAKLEHQQESGVVFMDKGKPGVFTSLLFAAWMNTLEARGYIHQHIFGDKETWWLACELTSTTYYFNPFYTGMMGHYEPGAKEMCSVQLLHLDSKGSPFWLNGGLRKNKRLDLELGQKDFATLTDYVPAGATWAEQPRWRYLKNALFCTDTSAKKVKSVEKAGLAQVIEDMIVEATEVDKMFPD